MLRAKYEPRLKDTPFPRAAEATSSVMQPTTCCNGIPSETPIREIEIDLILCGDGR